MAIDRLHGSTDEGRGQLRTAAPTSGSPAGRQVQRQHVRGEWAGVHDPGQLPHPVHHPGFLRPAVRGPAGDASTTAWGEIRRPVRHLVADAANPRTSRTRSPGPAAGGAVRLRHRRQQRRPASTTSGATRTSTTSRPSRTVSPTSTARRCSTFESNFSDKIDDVRQRPGRGGMRGMGLRRGGAGDLDQGPGGDRRHRRQGRRRHGASVWRRGRRPALIRVHRRDPVRLGLGAHRRHQGRPRAWPAPSRA